MSKLVKLVRVGPRLVFAFIAGFIIRMVRRMLRRPPRIWRGITGQASAPTHVAADRRAGFPSRSVVRHVRVRNYALVAESDFDVVYEAVAGRRDESHWLCLADLLLHADIWFAHFDSHLFRSDQTRMNEAVLLLARLAGIRLIAVPHGSDVVYRTRFRTRYDWVGRAQLDYPQWDLVAQREIVRNRIDLFCRYADLVMPGDSTLARIIPRADLRFQTVVMDCDALVPSPPQPRDVPRIIHAPNHRHVKGTDYLIQAVETLRARGIDSELVLIERVPRAQALGMYADADIIADQFVIGAYGIFACEGLALGKPVMTYLSEEQLGDPAFNQPLVNTTPENIVSVLAPLILIPELRDRLGRAGRESIVRYQSIEPMADLWARIYNHVWFGTPMRLEETAMFSPERKPRSFSENPLDEEFWPAAVGDLMEQIRQAVRKATG